MIKAAIFDLGNVTVKFDETPHFKKLAKTGKNSFSYVRDYYKGSATRKAFERGEVTPREFYRKFTEDLGLKISYNEFVQNYCDIFSRNKEIERVIKSLKGKVKLVLLSNTNVLQYEFIRKKFRVLDMFDEYVISYKSGMRKPNPFIFLKAVGKAGVMPWNCAYFDDIPEFVIMARLLGVNGFRYKDIGKLKRNLKQLKIPI